MRNEEIDRALAFLRQPRPCRVCGTRFRPEKWHALTCSDTCRSRRMRGRDLQYIDWLTTEVARYEARRLHENVDALIAQLKAHYRAVEARRHETDTAEIIGRFWLNYAETDVRIRLASLWAQQQTREKPEATPEMVLETINEIMPNYPAEAAAQIQAIILDRVRKRGERLTTEAASRVIGRIAQAVREGREISTEAILAELPKDIPVTSGELERIIKQEMKRTPSRATIFAGPGVSAMVVPGSGTPKTGVASTIIADQVPFRPLSPEATAILEKTFQAWRLAVIKAFDDMPKDDRVGRTLEAVHAAISKALPHIPPEAITEILKKDLT
jgi:hypothetical protein